MATHLRARHDMVRLVSLILVRVRHVLLMDVMVMYVMVWKGMEGKCIFGQNFQGKGS
jgi:hypothetical protein